RALNRSGRLWLGVAGAGVGLRAAIGRNQRTAQLVLVYDNRVVEWVAGMRTALLTDVMQSLHARGSRWTLRVLFWSTVAVLVVLRRFRHLFVFLGATLAVTALTGFFAYLFVLPRPPGGEILRDLRRYAHPPRPASGAPLGGPLRGLWRSPAPPAGLRRAGKPVIAGLVAALSVSLVYL